MIEKREDYSPSEADTELVEKIHDVEQKLTMVNKEKVSLGKRFDTVASQWREALKQLESRHEELETTMSDLQDLNDQLTESNALLLELKCQADQAEAKAIACDYEKTKFLARMSHEIRSPLAVVLGYADQILEDELDQDGCRRVASQIRNTSDFILEVVNEVLDLSKIEAGAFTLAASHTPIEHLIQDVYELFEQSAKQRGIDLKLDLRFPLPESMYVDGHRLKQVLVNLCSNAVKFTEKGAVEMRVWFDQGSVFFEVQDSGIGMTSSQLGKIFQPFTQAEDTITARFGGTGLGLYIAHEIVEQMGGKLTVVSVAGEGSCFKVALPVDLAGVKMATESSRTKSATVQQTTMKTLQGKVLVAEDTRDLQIIIGAVLKKAGLDVVLVNNGQQALDAFQGGGFDLVLLDVEMPVLDGVSAVKAMRNWEQQGGLRQCPVLALTAHAFKDEMTRLESEGFDAIVTKPFHRQSLLRTLEGWLERNRQTGEQ